MRLDHPSPSALLLSLLSLSALPTGALAARPKDAILLSEVQSLTLRASAKTSHRRVPPVPQLKCVSPAPLCKLASSVQTMRCTNQGSSYTAQDIEWACTASLPRSVSLDRTEVICEGYGSADDAYVLKGSCGVEYTLQLTEEGRREYPDLARRLGHKYGGDQGGEDGTELATVAAVVMILAVVVCVLMAFCGRDPGTRSVRGGNSNRGRGSGGGGDGWDNPPPPYPGSGPGSRPTSSSTEQQGWRPGFWTGLASGAAAGYTVGSRGRRNNSRYYGGNDRGSSGWGSGSGSGWASGRSSSSSGSGSGTGHESTGYGSTSRR
ncbi:hypothetical protein VTI74DRAFT_1495 [Chaetomium olivicolor]